MRILFAGLRYEYGKPEWGTAFEYRNFYEVLQRMEGVESRFIATDNGLDPLLRDRMNQDLLDTVKEFDPDLLFCFLFTDEVKKETIQYITKKTRTKTFNWFADDHWRFPIFSKLWAPVFTAVSTTDSQAVEKYKKLGVNVIKTQWAANTAIYFPLPQDKDPHTYEISFVGKRYGKRANYVHALQLAGLKAEGYGKGWPSGVVTDQAMLDIFSYSKVNLNFTESYRGLPKMLAKLAVRKSGGGYHLNLHNLVPNIQSAWGAGRRQIKGRTFEIPACGGFILTGDADNLSEYFEDGKEIVIFRDTEDLLKKSRYYLEHDNERKAIAQAGHERTKRDHTYEQRFKKIFEALGI